MNLLSAEAFGSPSLMQQICLQICFDNRVEEWKEGVVTLTLKDKRSFFGEMAGEINPIPLQVLMKGRSDRMDRTFASGEKGDIYVAVLKAIASLMPRSSIKSQDIKKAVTELVVAEIPQNHEITQSSRKNVRNREGEVERSTCYRIG